MIEEAYMTKCGHSFCYKCIHQSLEDNNRCPKCNYVVDNIDHLYPNFLVCILCLLLSASLGFECSLSLS
ncbi:RFWD2 isoform 5 [Pan troglodytes]|uniref:COP1 E3 ubiquitin ligase n=3 Tax=Hominidae TaxID=9604 RepID=E9PMW8_HUMAN|nr:COP1 E3 ubiquitin ligase [Homo sapiens]KAI4084037.1 COP1 E3 ubiquitin ligase [Homo sapiens]PNI67547.1 RFWD2 isoform 5 [Pan troglodytes]PNJ42808.1 RFWD2 isoform 9 [Pongo abelii]